MNRKRSPRRGGLALLLLCLSVPLTMGGCENFRNDVVDAFEVATRGLVDAVFDAAFDRLRSDQGF